MRLIDADNLKPYLRLLSVRGNESFQEAIEQVEKLIDNSPTIGDEAGINEWCTDCKEYDHRKHCCPRFNRVIRETLEEVMHTKEGKEA